MVKMYLILILMVCLIIIEEVHCNNRLLNVLNKSPPVRPHPLPLSYRNLQFNYPQFPSIKAHSSPLLYPNFQLNYPKFPSCGIFPNLNLDFLPPYPQLLPQWNEFPPYLHHPCKYCTPCQRPNCGENGSFGCFLISLKINQIVNVLQQINCNTKKIVNELSIRRKLPN